MVSTPTPIASPLPPKPNGRLYWRPRDIVEQTGLSKSTVMAALYAGELEGHRVGRAWLIPHDALERWIRGHEHAA